MGKQHSPSATFAFLSYHHADRETVNQVRSIMLELDEDGCPYPWWDQDIAPGADWAQTINEHIAQCAVFLVFVTGYKSILSSILPPTSSQHMRDECQAALRLGKPIIPVCIGQVAERDLSFLGVSHVHAMRIRRARTNYDEPIASEFSFAFSYPKVEDQYGKELLEDDIYELLRNVTNQFGKQPRGSKFGKPKRRRW